MGTGTQKGVQMQKKMRVIPMRIKPAFAKAIRAGIKDGRADGELYGVPQFTGDEYPSYGESFDGYFGSDYWGHYSATYWRERTRVVRHRMSTMTQEQIDELNRIHQENFDLNNSKDRGLLREVRALRKQVAEIESKCQG